MKLRKRMLALLLAAVMVLSVAVSAPFESKAATIPSGISKITKDKVYIYGYNSEFESVISAFEENYPQYRGLIKYVNTAASSDAYVKAIDKAAKSNKKAPSLFIADVELFPTMLQRSYVVPMSKVGYKNTWYKNAYGYTKTLGKKSGKLTALMYEVNPVAYNYDVKLAKKAFGKGDSKTVSAKIKNMNTLLASAKKAKSKKLCLLSAADEFRHIYMNSKLNDASYKNGTITLPSYIDSYAKISKEIVDNGYAPKYSTLWNDKWYSKMKNGSTIGCFGPEWFLDWTYMEGRKAKNSNFGIAEGPVASFWGGNGIFATNKAKNKGLIQLFLYTITSDTGFMVDRTKETFTCPNNTKAMQKIIKSGFGKKRGYANDPYVVWNKVAKAIKIKQPNVYTSLVATCVQEDILWYTDGVYSTVDEMKEDIKAMVEQKSDKKVK